jgi:hypothetical protein
MGFSIFFLSNATRVSNYGLLPTEGRSGRTFLDGSMIHVSIKLKSAPITSKKLMLIDDGSFVCVCCVRLRL